MRAFPRPETRPLGTRSGSRGGALRVDGLDTPQPALLRPDGRYEVYSTIPAETVAGAAQMVIYVVTAVALFVSLMTSARWAS